MPRPLTTDQLTALADSIIFPQLFVELTFVSKTLRYCTNNGDIDVLGHTWTGNGTLLDVSEIEETAQVEARGIGITLSALDTTLMTEVRTDYQLGLPATVYCGLYDAAFGNFIDDPFITWSGRMDQPVIKLTDTTATITIACENRLRELANPANRRYTQEDQQLDVPGDNGFQFVDGLQMKTIYWGGYPSNQKNM